MHLNGNKRKLETICCFLCNLVAIAFHLAIRHFFSFIIHLFIYLFLFSCSFRLHVDRCIMHEMSMVVSQFASFSNSSFIHMVNLSKFSPPFAKLYLLDDRNWLVLLFCLCTHTDVAWWSLEFATDPAHCSGFD